MESIAHILVREAARNTSTAAGPGQDMILLLNGTWVNGTNFQCTEELCPVSYSIYGYKPNLAVNALFLAIYALSGLAHGYQGFRYKTWSFMVAMTIGLACEVGGEVGRLMMHSDPFSDPGFKLQIVLLTFAPAFLSAGIYLTLKHLTIAFGRNLSRLRPEWYTWIFISCDIMSIAMQGAGGAIASIASDTQQSLLDVGNNLMIAGLAFQVFTLAIFGLLAADFFFRVWRNQDALNPATVSLRHSRGFKLFLGFLWLAYGCILVRCIYRVIELAGGWGNSIMQDEVTFIILDTCFIAIAAVALNFAHPGPSFLNKLDSNPTKVLSDDESQVNSGTGMFEMNEGAHSKYQRLDPVLEEQGHRYEELRVQNNGDTAYHGAQ